MLGHTWVSFVMDNDYFQWEVLTNASITLMLTTLTARWVCFKSMLNMAAFIESGVN